MSAIKTDELDAILNNTEPGHLDDFFKNNQQHMNKSDRPFYDYYKDVIKEKRLKLKDIYIAVGEDESYCGGIIREDVIKKDNSGEEKRRHTSNRDFIIKLCLAGHFLLEETNRALKLYNMRPLYSKDKRDACIIYEINRRVYDIEEVNKFLEDNGFDRFKAKEKEEE